MPRKKTTPMKILMGCDPELFVVNKDKQPRSAWGLVPGTKKEPFKVNKGAIQVDGMALEFNIDPAATEDEFVENIRTVMQELREKVPSDYEFLIKPSVKFHKNHLDAQPDEAKEMGCEPDFNAYTMAENPKPNPATTMRTAGGHIHIGFTDNADVNDPDHIMKCCTLAKHLDLFLGLRSLEWDKDGKRREMYGTPGSLRIKPYGMEYRPLSCAWLEKENRVRFVYRQTMNCLKDLTKNGGLEDYEKHSYDLVKMDIERGSPYFTIYNDAFRRNDRNALALKAANELKLGMIK